MLKYHVFLLLYIWGLGVVRVRDELDHHMVMMMMNNDDE